MEKLLMCRICLSDDNQLRLIVDTRFQKMYESLTSMPFVTEDGRPVHVCYLCCARLDSCYELRRRCLQSETLFTHLLRCNAQVNLQKLSSTHQSTEDELQLELEGSDDDHLKQELVEAEDPGDDPETRSAIKRELDDGMFHPGDDTETRSTVKTELDDVMSNPENDTEIRSRTTMEQDFVMSNPEDDTETRDTVKSEPDDVMSTLEKDPLEEDDWTQYTVNTAEGGVTDRDAVPERPRLVPREDYEAISLANLDRSGQTDDKIKEQKNETEQTVEDKPAQNNMRVKTRHEIGIKSQSYAENNINSDNSDVLTKIYEHNDSVNQTVESWSSRNTGPKSFTITHKPKTHRPIYSGEKRYQCNVCKTCFYRKQHLKEHIRTHTGEKPYQCSVCKKEFSRKHHLTKHIRTHTGEKPFQCSVCKKDFSGKSNLVNHIHTHTAERPFQCNVCKKDYRQKSILDIHKRTHTGERPFHCNVCKKDYRYKRNLDIHKRTHTGERPFQCNVCKKDFSGKSNLVSHIRTHTDERLFQCNVCKKDYRHKRNLNIHKCSHTGERPFQCSMCKKDFSVKSNLVSHIRTHTDETISV